MKKENKKDIISTVIIIAIIILIRTFIITPVKVNGDSMDSTLKDKEVMILSKIDYLFNDIKRFDIVVIKYGDEHIIKRVIGLPGEILEYKNNTLYINGKIVKEKYLNEKTEDFNIASLNYNTIPNNCYIVLGDNRDVSYDSRYIGCIDKDDILGSANLVIFPFNNIGYKK